MMTIGIVGDYNPQYSLHLATESAFARMGAEARWIPTPAIHENLAVLSGYGGLLITPGSPYQSMAGALDAIRYAREQGLALLGTCSGFQHVLVEFARSVIGISGADHAGLNPDASDFVCAPLACSVVGEDRPVLIQAGTLAGDLYQAEETVEPFYCSYGLNPSYRGTFAKAGMRFSGHDRDGVERVLEVPAHPFFLATLYVPQAAAARDVPHPVLAGFACASGAV